MYEDKIGILLVNYKKPGDTIECIKSIKNLNYDNYLIIVIDNESGDDTLGSLVNDESLVIIPVEKNLGFGGANNLGYKRALELGCDLVWILNNDTIVVPDTLNKLVETMTEFREKTAIVGATLRYSSDLGIQAIGGGKVSWCLGIAPLTKRYSSELDFISGACMLVNPPLVGEVVFDPRYFMYWEDTDFSLRMKKKGHLLRVAQTALVIHKESASLGKFNPILERHYGRSMTLFFLDSRFPFIPLIFGLGLRSFRRVIRGRMDAGAALVGSALTTVVNYRGTEG